MLIEAQHVTPSLTVAAPLRLPCGVVLRNRLAKAAMSEALADGDGRPTDALCRLYRRWGASGVGLLVTGNAVLDAAHVERPGNVILDDNAVLPTLTKWAEAATSSGAAAILQINHAGRQTTRFVNSTPLAPSAVPALKLLGMFGRPRAASVEEISQIRRRFVRAALLTEAAGFSGAQIHAAHGYLLNQFLSPDCNRREDEWGGSIANRARLLLEIVREVRARVRPSFAVTVKLNTGDFHAGGLEEDDAAEVVRLLENEGIDLLELSGGTYTRGASFGEGVAPSPREAYFLAFTERVRRTSSLPLMLTGGFRSRAAMDGAIGGRGADVVGLARPLALEPELPRRLLESATAVSAARPMPFAIAKLRGAAELAWYSRQIRRIADGLEPEPRLSMAWSLWLRVVEDRVAARRLRLKEVRRIDNCRRR
jgi:2,4-dienoyl-CoA reductase-like NADH-dependent reductase (Old Yellow Enzyme family)